MKLIFLHGAPAVGKLTVAEELARLTGFRLFHNHLTVDLVTSLFPFGSEPFIALREQIWLAAFREAAQDDVSLIFTFNPESTVRETLFRKRLTPSRRRMARLISSSWSAVKECWNSEWRMLRERSLGSWFSRAISIVESRRRF